MTRVWIVIVGYRNLADVIACFRAVATQTYREWGVVICENGGPQAFYDLCTAFSAQDASQSFGLPKNIRSLSIGDIDGQPLRCLEAATNLGYAGGINAGIADVEPLGDWTHIWVLNPDTAPHKDALRQLLMKAEDPRYGIIGSRLVYEDTRLIQAYGGLWQFYKARGVSLGRGQPLDAPVDIDALESKMDYVLGASMLVSRRYIRDIGLMNDDYFLYCEEVDWCLRRQTYKLGYAHDSIVTHTQGTTIGSKGSPSGRSRLAVYLDERNRLLLTRRFFPRRFPIAAIVTGLRLSRYAAGHNFLIAVSGWWDGLRGRSGAPRRRFHSAQGDKTS